MKNRRIIITCDYDFSLVELRDSLRQQEFDVVILHSYTQTLPFIHNHSCDLVIICSKGHNINDGLPLVRDIKASNQHLPIILITEKSSEDRVIAALRSGVNDYLKEPLTCKDLLKSIHDIFPDKQRWPLIAVSRNSLVGESLSMHRISEYLARVAMTDSTVLITGETGTGKELVANIIHKMSSRQTKPFVCVNCAALPDSLIESEMFGYERGAFTGAVSANVGKLEAANGGTLFLDEIGDMSSFAQAKILRAVESKEIQRLGSRKSIPLNVRITAATNRDPEKLVAEGQFREDLYYRLNIARIHLPPLRDRKEDIPCLVSHAIKKLNRNFDKNIEGINEDTLVCLLQYNWPGNVRELINLIESTFINVSSRRITQNDLPSDFLKRVIDAREQPPRERDQLLSALLATKWNKSKAAQKLRWSRMTLYRKIEKYHIVSGSRQ